MENVRDQAQEKVSEVTERVREQAQNLSSEMRVQFSERSIVWRDRGVGRLRSLATELRQMAAVPTGSSDTAHQAARFAADRIDMICAQLEQRDPGDLMVEAKSYARNHPTQIVLAMFATGALVGRMVRGAKSGSSRQIDLRRAETSAIPDVGYIA